jgi:FKBP-type peptidyl-prolyl cis-trans isomerase 2
MSNTPLAMWCSSHARRQGSYAGAVVQVREDGAVLFDFNHPLAGQPVTFEVKLIGVLEMTHP